MNNGKQDTNFLCADPSCFLSSSAISDLTSVLQYQTLKDEIKSTNVRVLIPTSLYSGLNDLREKRISTELLEIFRSWLPHYDPELINEIIEDLSYDQRYIEKISTFLDKEGEFYAWPVEEISYRIDKIGENSIFKAHVLRNLGKTIGGVIFEMLVAANKVNAKIISFAEETVHLIRRLGIEVKKGHSAYKSKIKRNKNIKRSLTLGGIFFNAGQLEDFLHSMQISGIEIRFLLGMISVGVYVVANG